MKKKYDLIKAINMLAEPIESYRKKSETHLVKLVRSNDCNDYKVTDIKLEEKNSPLLGSSIGEASPTHWRYESFNVSTSSTHAAFAQEIGATTSIVGSKTVFHDGKFSLMKLNQALEDGSSLNFFKILSSNNKDLNGVRIIGKPNNFFKKFAKFFSINHKIAKDHRFETENKNIPHHT